MKIALTGISGSGKDYLVSHLLDIGYTRISFSDQLKKLCKIIYPWMEADYPPLEKEQPLNITLSNGEFIDKTPREIWLHLNMLRDVEDGLFTRMLQEEMESIEGDIVISDIRPELEFLWCKDNNFTTVYIEPSKRIYEPNSFDSNIPGYKSRVDYVFKNNFNGLDEWKEFIEKIRG